MYLLHASHAPSYIYLSNQLVTRKILGQLTFLTAYLGKHLIVEGKNQSTGAPCCRMTFHLQLNRQTLSIVLKRG